MIKKIYIIILILILSTLNSFSQVDNFVQNYEYTRYNNSINNIITDLELDVQFRLGPKYSLKYLHVDSVKIIEIQQNSVYLAEVYYNKYNWSDYSKSLYSALWSITLKWSDSIYNIYLYQYKESRCLGTILPPSPPKIISKENIPFKSSPRKKYTKNRDKEPWRCKATTLKGYRCTRRAKYHGYCWQHY